MQELMIIHGCEIRPVSTPGSLNAVYIIGAGREIQEMRELCADLDADIVTISCRDYNADTTPWPAPGVYNSEGDFSGGAVEYLGILLGEIIPEIERELPIEHERRYIAGYSLSGLFALWSVYNTNLFDGVSCGSGSLWYDGWLDYMREHRPVRDDLKCYISVGAREKKTRNVRMATVEKSARAAEEILCGQGYRTEFELNPGNHFTDIPLRIKKGIAWLLETEPGK